MDLNSLPLGTSHLGKLDSEGNLKLYMDVSRHSYRTGIFSLYSRQNSGMLRIVGHYHFADQESVSGLLEGVKLDLLTDAQVNDMRNEF